jgi:hypothetical protein
VTGVEKKRDNGVYAGNSVVDLKSPCCIVVNTTDKAQLIRDGEKIGRIVKLEEDDILQPVPNKGPAETSKRDERRGEQPPFEKVVENVERTKPQVNIEGCGLTPEQHERASKLLCEFDDVFAEDLENPGKLRGFECTIDTDIGVTPIYTRDFRKSQQQHEEIKRSIDDKLKKKTAEPGTGSWSFPILMVPKKNGVMRMCVDLRGLNAITKTIIFPIPRPTDMFDAVRGACWFSLGDATWGYWQMGLKEEDRDKAAYSTREGLFRPTTMDFGMKNAPAQWQRAMNIIFTGLLWTRCVIYIDDLLIFSKTFDEHLENMRLCLTRCREYNLKLRPTKCSFFRHKISFLGHEISGDGIGMEASKVKAITSLPIPDTAEKLHSWICFAQYYKDHIKNFADEVRLLRILAAADKYQWKDIHTAAFERLKRLVLENVMLAHPIPGKRFFLECDASNWGLGMVLSQENEEGVRKVICFGSKALTPTQQNYSAPERECLAVVEGIKQFYIYLHGAEFVVVTDHKALEWLMKHKDPTSKLMRWAIKLQGYNFTIQHRPGKHNANVDALSRLVTAEPRAQTLRDPMEVMEILDISDAQRADPELRGYIDYLMKEKLPTDGDRARKIVGMSRFLEVEEGILYYLWEPAGGRHKQILRRQIAIPESYRHDVLKECHDSCLTGGHLGIAKTYLKMTERYWWKDMYKQTKEYVKGCLPCQQRKGARPINDGLIQPIVATEPFELVGMDLFGPLPATEEGYEWVIVFTDKFTKWIEILPIKRANEEATAAALINAIICRHGVMARLLSDRGKNFIGRMMVEIYKELKIKKVTTTAWHPQGNGQTEAFNKPLARMLAAYANENHRDWDKYLPFIQFAYNTSVHETTKFSPFYLIYGREPRFPIELANGGADYAGVGGTASLAEEIENRFRVAFELAKHNQDLANFKMVVRGDKQKHRPEYKVGQKVWLYIIPRTNKKKGIHKKLKYPWQGPYLVTKQVSPNIVELKLASGGHVKQVVHVNRIKAFFEQGKEQLRPSEEPTLDEEDEFNYEQERVVNKSALTDGEGLPDDEDGVVVITAFRVRSQGVLEYEVKWEKGDKSWVLHEDLENCAALDKFFDSRRHSPLFGLEIKLKWLESLFMKKKYAYTTAQKQLIAVFKEFMTQGEDLTKLLGDVKGLYSIGEVRKWTSEYVKKFKERILPELKLRGFSRTSRGRGEDEEQESEKDPEEKALEFKEDDDPREEEQDDSTDEEELLSGDDEGDKEIDDDEALMADGMALPSQEESWRQAQQALTRMNSYLGEHLKEREKDEEGPETKKQRR